METRPPALIEGIVRLLIPPVSREHVLGDLSERYVSPRSYVIDAVRTIPFVVASRVRRAIDPAMFLVGILFIWLCIFWGPFQESWMTGLIPTVICSIVLLLRDAYRPLAANLWIAVSVDILCFVAGAAVSQGVLATVAPQWMLPLDSLLWDSSLGLVILFLLRVQIPSGMFAHKTSASSLTMDELASEIRTYEQTIRRAIRIELGVGAFFIGGTIAGFSLLFVGSTVVEKAALAITLASVLFVWWFIYRYCRVRSIPVHLGFEQAVAAYRKDLEYRCGLSSTYLWWYLLPLSVGPVVFTIASAPRMMSEMRIPAPGFVMAFLIGSTILIMAVFGAMLLWVQRRAIRRTRERIDQLSMITEKI